MLQTTSLLSMLGMQTQQQSALPLQQTLSGAAPAAAQQAGGGGQSIDQADQPGSLFQMILKFMQSPNASSASALQQRLANAASAQHGAAESSITLPFPLGANDAPSADDQSASGVMQFSPLMFTSIAQLQQALQAAARGQAPAIEEGDSDTAAAVIGVQTNAAAESDAKESKDPRVLSAGAEGGAAEALLPVVTAQQPADMADPASLISAAASVQQMTSAADSVPQQAAATEAPAQVSASSALGARTIAAEEMPIAQERAAVPQARSASPSSQARQVSAAEPTVRMMNAEESSPEFSTQMRAALADAHEAATPAAVPGARQPLAAAGPNAAGVQADAENAADAAAVIASDPARTPEIFTRLHEAIAQAQEPAAAKNTVKAAPVQQTRSSQKASTDARTISAADMKQVPDASAHDEPLGAQPTAVRAANDQSAEQAQSASQSKSASHDTTQTAQHNDAASVDVHAAAKAELQTPHSALAANDVQTRAAVTTRDASTVLSPRAKEDVFEKVFREVSTIKHTPASVDVTLSPESLGKVTVNVGMEEGKMSARINVQNTDVKQIIEANMSRLQDALNSSGLSLDSIAVFVNNSSSFADRKNDAPKKKQASGDLASESAVDMLGTLPQESKQLGYNTVEYIM